MINPRQKASELVYQFYRMNRRFNTEKNSKIIAKESALIVVKEVIKDMKWLDTIVYWQEVKEEIEKL